MAKLHYLCCTLLLLSISLCTFSQCNISEKRQELIDVYRGEIGVREETGNNDGERIAEYLISCDLNPQNHDPWCAAFIYWCHQEVDVVPFTGWPAYSPSWAVEGITVAESGKELSGYSVLPGDVGCLYFREKGRIAHVCFIDRIEDEYYVTVEGNTNVKGSREGDGVYRRKRKKGHIKYITRHIQ